ncbi:MAG: phosphate ABC transporter permease PstA [Planctomycetota bacterium]|nr:phosphate ABC transporter permease PstA [Planctomycetota bacterium]
MSSELATPPSVRPPRPSRGQRTRRAVSPLTTLSAHGEPMVWLTGGALAIALAMIVILLAKIFYEGAATFWPSAVVEATLLDGRKLMGEVTTVDSYRPADSVLSALPEKDQAAVRQLLSQNNGWATRQLIRTGNFELSGSHYTWVDDFAIKNTDLPEWGVIVERLAEVDQTAIGRFYGYPKEFLIDGETVASDPHAVWNEYRKYHDQVQARWRERVELEKHGLGAIRRNLKEARLDIKRAELSSGIDSDAYRAAVAAFEVTEKQSNVDTSEILGRIEKLNEENARYSMKLAAADGTETNLAIVDVVRAYPPNKLTWWEKTSVYFDRWREFLFSDPRNANSEGGVLPAIWGTVAMTLIMSVLVVPFGVLAALYLREYSKGGTLVTIIRIAINNLAGVPSIVFGVFGLGFFCYVMGVGIDQLFFQAELADNSPTFGTGGLMWASLTLALLTLPVVIVATEEALSAVPNSMREGSYACGASKWQTIKRIVLPRALPGIMTGTILAMARGAGEVAPLMLVGVVKLAPELPVDSVFPFIHPERSFMHLGFHIYDVGLQSQNSEAAKPMVYTTTLLLITLIVTLNIAATYLRSRLRKKFVLNQF